MEYMIIEANTRSELERLVNGWLDHNWQLQGGVCVTQTMTATIKTYSQAMIFIKPKQHVN